MAYPAEQLARESLAAWEKAAGQWSDSMVRDPRTLDFGAGMLRAGLLWKRAMDEAAQQTWTQWVALIGQSSGTG